jgi:hypothetical protein
MHFSISFQNSLIFRKLMSLIHVLNLMLNDYVKQEQAVNMKLNKRFERKMIL